MLILVIHPGTVCLLGLYLLVLNLMPVKLSSLMIIRSIMIIRSVIITLTVT